jgi:hypothetical protein
MAFSACRLAGVAAQPGTRRDQTKRRCLWLSWLVAGGFACRLAGAAVCGCLHRRWQTAGKKAVTTPDSTDSVRYRDNARPGAGCWG